MRNRYIFLVLSILVLSACKKQRLNGIAFPSEKLESYAFENYTGEISVPDSILADAAHYTPIDFQSYSSETNESYTIYGVFIGDLATISSDTLIVYFHGQSKHMDHYFGRASLLANAGGKYNYNVLMIDYRGYGMSEGESSEQGLYEDADATIDWLINQGADPQKTIFYGYSLGAIPSIDRVALRDDFKPAKLMIESPLASVSYLVHNSTILQLDPNAVTDHNFENAEKIKLVDKPLCWLHGIEDTYIAIDNGELIYNNHGGTVKEAHRIENSDHSEIPTVMGIENYLEVITTFIRQ
jgi:alpha/beta superfamily hydrolase